MLISLRSSGPMSFGFQSLETHTMSSIARNVGSPGEFPTAAASPPESNHSATSLRNEMVLFFLLYLISKLGSSVFNSRT